MVAEAAVVAATVAAVEVVAEAVEVVVVGKAVVAVEEAADLVAAEVVDPVSLVSSFLRINCSIPSDTNYFRRNSFISCTQECLKTIFLIVFTKRLITSLLFFSRYER